MAAKVRCPNPDCGWSSPLGDDPLGRAFRCPRCRARFAKGDPSGLAFSVPMVRPIPRASWGDPARASVPSGGGEAACRPGLAESVPHVGRFRIVGPLGSGAFATVYRAFDPRLQRDVALKVLNAGVVEGSRAAARFLAEARAMARLDHPRIVAIHEAGSDGGRHYLASTFVDGPSLARSIEDGPRDPRSSARVAADLAEALAYAHGRGVVHRDVKPGNILVDARGAAHLSDFGLAHCLDSSERLTLDGALLGTPAYMAPERAGGGGDLLPASDQYGLGAVLYEMLCGRPPFVGPPLLVLYQAVHQDPPRPRSLRPDLPPELEAICLRALARRPDDRYPDCQALADALRAWLEGEPSPRGRRGRPSRAARRPGRLPGPAATMALVALALAAAPMLLAARSLVPPRAAWGAGPSAPPPRAESDPDAPAKDVPLRALSLDPAPAGRKPF